MSCCQITASRRNAPCPFKVPEREEWVVSSDRVDDQALLLAHSVGIAKEMARQVNHDFNNLISVVRGYASILQGTPRLDEDSRKLFTPFLTTKSGKGRGLGATVVYEIVKSHGGHLEVSSRVGLGSCIDLYFPSSGDAEDQPRPEPGASDQENRPTLLVVDDDDMVRLAI